MPSDAADFFIQRSKWAMPPETNLKIGSIITIERSDSRGKQTEVEAKVTNLVWSDAKNEYRVFAVTKKGTPVSVLERKVVLHLD
jgi:hypothetical protein